MALTKPRAYQIFNLDYKQAVRVLTDSNINLTGGAPNLVDGVTLVADNRVLVRGQDDASQNGIYIVDLLGTGNNGTWIRSVDANQTGEIQAGMIVMVTEGNSYKDTQWKLTTNDPITVGVTNLVFELNVSTNQINNGNSTIGIASLGANATVNINGVANVAVFTPTGISANNIATEGNIVVGNNLVVNGNLTYVNVTDLNIEDPIIGLGRGPNNTPLTTDDNKDRGTQLWYYTTQEQSAFIGWDDSAGKLIAAANVDINNEIVTVNAYGELVVGALEALTVSASGNVISGNVLTSGIVSATGNITGNYILGNGSQLTGMQSFVGATGPQGPVGATGATGIQGEIGATGASGIQGEIGATGFTGATGVTGDIGATGASGVQGDIGATGASGIQGEIGATGASGVQGDIGATGASGIQGEIGATGASGIQGEIGATGFAGATGIQGEIGATGASGIQGEIGATGASGIQGEIGATGASGIQGEIGATGFTGATGVTGATGAQGQSASYYNYKTNTSSTSGDPGNGRVLWNNSTQTSATQINIDHLTDDIIDIDVFLSLITTTDFILLQDTNNSANYQKWEVTGTPSTVSNNYWMYPVTLVSSGGTGTTGFADNNAIIVAISYVGAAGATGPAGATGLTGATGVQGNVGATGAFSNTLTSDIDGAGFGISNISFLSATGNVTSANVFATRLSGTLSTAAQPNVTLLGTLSSLSVSGNIQGGDLRTIGVVSAAGNIQGGNLLTTGFVSATGNITANYFIGNGSLLTGISSNSISNGTSNITIPTANGNINVYTNGQDTVEISPGELTVYGVFSNPKTITSNVVIGPPEMNSLLIGPINVAPNSNIFVPTGSTLNII